VLRVVHAARGVFNVFSLYALPLRLLRLFLCLLRTPHPAELFNFGIFLGRLLLDAFLALLFSVV
jgi:hypothetical protein